jgi:hypothetical protein
MSAQDAPPADGRPSNSGRRVPDVRDGYGLTLILTVVTIGSLAALGVGSIGGLVTVALTGATLMLALDASEAHRHVVRVAAIAVVAALLMSALALASGEAQVAEIAAGTLGLIIAAVVPLVILRHIVRSAEVTIRLVLGAIVVYLLIGLCYSSAYPILAGLTGEPFFVQVTDPTSATFIYFSYTTLTTVGFGDLSAGMSTGQLLSVSEALVGQLYLVSIVAVLVSNLGRPISRSRDAS